ncbi:MAG: TlyA family RNA methyltransferase [Nitrospirae bacterium]|nr:TlyA family RNA methyltransferase [Nitrospirota bacterium]
MSNTKKIRLDKLIFEKGLAPSREKAQALILEGNVLVNGIKVDKAGTLVREDAQIEILQRMPYVSRGGLKLEGAIKDFGIDVTGKTAMDVGASTGGFTDCLLQHGAKKVYAIDVGYGQLDWKLRNDQRVVVLEKANMRYLEDFIKRQGARVEGQEFEDLIKGNIDMATIDVSFISLTKVMPEVIKFLKKDGEIIALIKPQFEAERKDIKKGVVRDEAKRLDVVEKIKDEIMKMGLQVKGVIQSPIKGPKGNIEYLVYIEKSIN